MTRPILLTGDSHLSALKKAFDRDPDACPGITFAPLGKGGDAVTPFFVTEEDGRAVRTTPEGWRNQVFSRETLGDRLLVLSLPMNTSRILRDCAWHTHVPWALRAHDTEIALSDAAVAAMIDTDSRFAIAFARALKQARLDIAVLEGPRFFSNARYLDRKRFAVCQHIDALYRTQVGTALQAAGVPVIAQPAATIDPTGTTRLAFDHENPRDTHHANTDYGALALQDILTFAERANAA